MYELSALNFDDVSFDAPMYLPTYARKERRIPQLNLDTKEFKRLLEFKQDSSFDLASIRRNGERRAEEKRRQWFVGLY